VFSVSLMKDLEVTCRKGGISLSGSCYVLRSFFPQMRKIVIFMSIVTIFLINKGEPLYSQLLLDARSFLLK
jgi:hypothetical protein